MPTKEQAIEALKQVQDPEIGIDVWTLGLIYEMDIKGKDMYIKMTFTSPMCPYGPQLVGNIKQKLKEIKFNEPKVEVTFSPPWEPSQELREMLGV